MIEKLKKILAKKMLHQRGFKRKMLKAFFSLLLIGNLFIHPHAHAADVSSLQGLNTYARPHKARDADRQNNAPEAVTPDPGLEKARDGWAAAALLARPLLFEHEDCQLFQGKKKIGNFGVFWPKKINLPTDAAFRRYVKSEERIVGFIVDRLGAGAERDLTLYQMAQVYSFVYNTTVASGDRALNALKTGGMKTAQAFMSRVDRVRGMKSPLRGLTDRRKDEAKLGAGELDIPISRRMAGGQPHTLASLQAHYNVFVSLLGEAPNDDATSDMPNAPGAQRHVRGLSDEPASDPI